MEQEDEAEFLRKVKKKEERAKRGVKRSAEESDP
jgi:hypothetical protein